MKNNNCTYLTRCILRLASPFVCDDFTPDNCPMANLYKRIESLEEQLQDDELNKTQMIFNEDIYELSEGDVVK